MASKPFRFKVKLPKVALLDPRQHPFIVDTLQYSVFTQWAGIIGKSARSNTPIGATGNLNRNISMDASKTGNVYTFITTWNERYGASVNSGSRPHPVAAFWLFAWAQLKTGSKANAYKIARHIRKFGTRPNNFLSRVERGTRTQVLNAFSGMGRAIALRLVRR